MKTGPLIVILGETATGKSDLAMKLAKLFNGEIIAADSTTIRKFANIGTSKPSLDDQQLIKHHLIDVVDPDQEFNVSIYKELALKSIIDIESRNKIPFLVGGSGLYIDAVIYNYKFTKYSEFKNRDYLNSLNNDQLLNIIESRSYDKQGIDLNNKRRLIRLIESDGKTPTKDSLRENTLTIGLKRTTEDLGEHILKRIDYMIKEGLIDEVKYLSDHYGWNIEILRAVGYKQWQLYFNKVNDLEMTKDLILKDSLNLAKKQRTWFKRNQAVNWFVQPINTDEIVDLVTTYLSNNSFN